MKIFDKGFFKDYYNYDIGYTKNGKNDKNGKMFIKRVCRRFRRRTSKRLLRKELNMFSELNIEGLFKDVRELEQTLKR